MVAQWLGWARDTQRQPLSKLLASDWKKGFTWWVCRLRRLPQTWQARLGIPLAGLDEIESIDITVDGADEVDPELNLIKGLGGALVREKIVASCSRRLVILVGSEKLVSTLGEHGVLPVEIVPFAVGPCRRRLIQLDYSPVLRQAHGQPFLTDNGNYVLDCQVQPLMNPTGLEQTLRSIPGVVGTGLFLGMAPTVLIDEGGRIEERSRR